MNIPVSKPSITNLEKKYVTMALESGWISSTGEFIDSFESEWAQYNLMEYGVSCNSGTSALFLALKALGIKEGDEVIVPEFTMVATAWAVSYCGATPVFVDCNDQLLIKPSLIESKITNKTKAIIPVHVYGRRCEMGAINKIALEYNLYVIEDSAEAHGIKPTGDIACYSFFANKIITTGEGGMCLTNNYKLAEQMRFLKNMTFDSDKTFIHKRVGYNLRMTNVQAALGLAQIRRFDEIISKRDRIESWYNERLPKEIQMPIRNVLWMYDIHIDNREKVLIDLKNKGIECRRFFRPMSEQFMYKNNSFAELRASYWSNRGLYLPTYTDMTEEDVDKICTAIRGII